MDRIWFNPERAEALREAGFHGMGDFLAKGEVIRDRDGKENVQVALPFGPESLLAHLKRHRPSRFPPGREEWKNHLRVEGLGIPVAEVLAVGWSREGSFFMTAAIPGALPLDDFARDALSNLENRATFARRRRIARDLAELVRSLHQGGLCHRDLYLCHVLIAPGRDDRLYLIDLQRVRRTRPFRRRWTVKDLAALAYSSRDLGVTRSESLRFLKTYLGGRPPRHSLRSLANRIRRKEARIRRHTEKHKKMRPGLLFL